MKKIFIAGIFLPLIIIAPALALDAAPAGSSSPIINKQAAAPQSPGSSAQHLVSPVPNPSPLELNALYGGSSESAVQDLQGNKKQTSHVDPSVMEKWRDRVVSTLSAYFSSRQQNPFNTGWSSGHNKSVSRTSDGRIVTKLIMRETLKFARENVPRIDALIKSLKIEVASDSTMREKSVPGEIKTNNEIVEHQAGNVRPDKSGPAAQDNVVFKTGLRVRVETGKLGLVSETEAKYGRASYFYKINLDNQSDNSLGFKYILGRTTSIQIERNFSHTLNPVTRNKPSVDVIQVGLKF